MDLFSENGEWYVASSSVQNNTRYSQLVNVCHGKQDDVTNVIVNIYIFLCVYIYTCISYVMTNHPSKLKNCRSKRFLFTNQTSHYVKCHADLRFPYISPYELKYDWTYKETMIKPTLHMTV